MLLISKRLAARAVEAALRAALGARLQVAIAGSVAAALDSAREEPVDALVLDLDLAGKNPAAEVRRLQQRAPDAAVIVVTADGMDGARELQGLLPPSHQVVAGDEAPAALIRAVAQALHVRQLERRVDGLTLEVEQSQARFRDIIERNADGIVIVGQDRTVRFMNPAAETLFRRNAGELIGEEFGFPLVVGDTTELDLVARGAEKPIVVELRATDTQWNGEPAQLVSLRDITDRKEAEQKAHRLVLEKSAREQAEHASRRSAFLAEASAALDSSLDLDSTLAELARLMVPRVADWCVIDLVEDDRIRRVAGAHASAERQGLLQEWKRRFPPHQDSTQPASRALGEGRSMVLNGLDRRQLEELTRDHEHAQLLVDLGSRSAVAVPLCSRRQVVGAMTVVCSERDFGALDVALIEEVAVRAGRAIENARLYRAALAASQAKSDFLAIVSHELRTPLNAIMGYSELLLSGIGGELDEQQTRALRRIDASARHLLQMIEEILTHAGLEAGRGEPRPQDVVLGELVESVVAIAEPLVRERELEFRLEISDPASTLYTDPGKVRQIVLNLLSNAAKFTQNGQVTLRAGVRDGTVVVAVSDTGVGIAAEHTDSIFDPFWQAEHPLTRHAGGTGLGLSVSRRLAHMLGGSLVVESEPGVGSTFTLRLPAHYRAEAHGK